MRKYDFVTAAWLIVVAAVVGGQAFSQTITKAPNKLGLDIESVTVDAAASTAKIVVHNTSGRPITAYVVNLAPAYSDGEKLSGESLIDFFGSLGLARVIPPGSGTDSNNLDAITSGASRESTFSYEKAQTAGAQLASIRVDVTGLIFEDESTAGDSKRIGEIVHVRDAESAEVVRWCADVNQFSHGPVPRKAVNDILAVHGPAPKLTGRPVPGQGAAEAERMELLGNFHWGLKWQSDDTATLQPFILDVFEVRCKTAREHLKRRALQ